MSSNPLISVLCPTIPGREGWLAKLEESVARCGGHTELVVSYDGDNWGKATNIAAERTEGDYLFLASDDVEVMPGWWQAAIAVCDKGQLPAPKVLNTDGSLQSCGDWEREQPDGDSTLFPRFPFLSREQWELLGPLLPIHFSDVYLGTNARDRHGVETVVCHAYRLVHHMVDIGRRDYRTEERLRQRTERDARRAVRAG